MDAKPSVAFMTVNTGVSYLGLFIFIAYRGREFKAASALLLAPATVILLISIEVEYETEFDYVLYR